MCYIDVSKIQIEVQPAFSKAANSPLETRLFLALNIARISLAAVIDARRWVTPKRGETGKLVFQYIARILCKSLCI